jgi:hypothetical protein
MFCGLMTGLLQPSSFLSKIPYSFLSQSSLSLEMGNSVPNSSILFLSPRFILLDVLEFFSDMYLQDGCEVLTARFPNVEYSHPFYVPESPKK